jgi:hypothetical protein
VTSGLYRLDIKQYTGNEGIFIHLLYKTKWYLSVFWTESITVRILRHLTSINTSSTNLESVSTLQVLTEVPTKNIVLGAVKSAYL